jgi:rubrerythrin
MSLAAKIQDLDTFLAYSVALEEEAAERHEELADMMEVHHNTEAMETFSKLAHYSRLHAQEIRDHARGHTLPYIAPWEFGWDDMEGPETADVSDVNYLMSTAHALKIAIGNEQRAHDFYHGVSQGSPDPGVRALAAEFAEEEKEHLALLLEWQARCPDPDEENTYDPDPAHMPE